MLKAHAEDDMFRIEVYFNNDKYEAHIMLQESEYWYRLPPTEDIDEVVGMIDMFTEGYLYAKREDEDMKEALNDDAVNDMEYFYGE